MTADRWLATTTTWLKKTVASLGYDAGRDTGERLWLAGYRAGNLLGTLIDESSTLAGIANDEDLDELETAAKDLVRQLRKRRLAVRLGDVAGRTPAEAAAFAAKAAQLRA